METISSVVTSTSLRMDVNAYREGARNSPIVESQGMPTRVDADIVIPVYNEEEDLRSCVVTLCRYLAGACDEAGYSRDDGFPADFTWKIVIADNASTDGTWAVATALSKAYPDFVRAVRINRKGRGFALKTAWSQSLAQVVAYMDVDLSTGLEHIDELVVPVLTGEADISFGSRLMRESRVKRSLKREFISRSYNTMLHVYSKARFHDAQCGFKAMSTRAARKLLPKIEDDAWFFDTEMLLIAQNEGMCMHEIPVRWVEDANSTVKIGSTALEDLKGMRRLRLKMDALNNPAHILRNKATIAAYKKDFQTGKRSAFAGSLIAVSALA